MFVITGVASFVVQYAASGALEAPLMEQHLAGLPLLDLLLAATALLQWYLFDRTSQGMFGAAGGPIPCLTQQDDTCVCLERLSKAFPHTNSRSWVFSVL